MTPVAKTGLHCGAESWRRYTMPASLVTPVAKTGLHCGFSMVGGTMAYGTPVTPVAKTGLHCGRELVAREWPKEERDPGREDRAPLRLQPVLVVDRPAGLVTPVAKTGLHCGDFPETLDHQDRLA